MYLVTTDITVRRWGEMPTVLAACVHIHNKQKKITWKVLPKYKMSALKPLLLFQKLKVFVLPCFGFIKQGLPSAIQETQLFQNLYFICRFCCGSNFFSFSFDRSLCLKPLKISYCSSQGAGWGLAEGFLAAASPRVQAAGAPLSGEERVRRKGCGERAGSPSPLPTSSLVRVLWAPCPSLAPTLGANWVFGKFVSGMAL